MSRGDKSWSHSVSLHCLIRYLLSFEALRPWFQNFYPTAFTWDISLVNFLILQWYCSTQYGTHLRYSCAQDIFFCNNGTHDILLSQHIKISILIVYSTCKSSGSPARIRHWGQKMFERKTLCSHFYDIRSSRSWIVSFIYESSKLQLAELFADYVDEFDSSLTVP